VGRPDTKEQSKCHNDDGCQNGPDGSGRANTHRYASGESRRFLVVTKALVADWIL